MSKKHLCCKFIYYTFQYPSIL